MGWFTRTTRKVGSGSVRKTTTWNPFKGTTTTYSSGSKSRGRTAYTRRPGGKWYKTTTTYAGKMRNITRKKI
jgi:hypothetical protein